MSHQTKHIAVIRLSAMGDVAMTVPVLRAFASQYPEVKITMVSRAFFKPFFQGLTNVDFFAVDLEQRHKGFLGLYRLYSDLKKQGVDAFADLHQVLRSKIVRSLFALSGRKTASLDKGREEKKALTRTENKIFKQLPTAFERQQKVFAELGFPVDLENPVFPPKQKLDEAVVGLTGEKNNKWIGIAPFAQHQQKVYPQDLMQKVIDELASDENYQLFLFGGGNREIAILNQLANHHKNAVVVAGKIDFKQEIQLISNLDIMLSMDSGNGHIAAINGVKVITLWGATHPFAGFAPFHQPLENSLIPDLQKFPKLPTSIYGNKEIPRYEDAMRTISPELVVEKIEVSIEN